MNILYTFLLSALSEDYPNQTIYILYLKYFDACGFDKPFIFISLAMIFIVMVNTTILYRAHQIPDKFFIKQQYILFRIKFSVEDF